MVELAHIDLRATRDPGDVVRNIALDVHRAELGPGFVFWRYLWARMEYGANIEHPKASMTELLMAASFGR